MRHRRGKCLEGGAQPTVRHPSSPRRNLATWSFRAIARGVNRTAPQAERLYVLSPGGLLAALGASAAAAAAGYRPPPSQFASRL